MKHAILNAKEPPGEHMDIFALGLLPQRIFSAVVISSTAVLSLPLFQMKANADSAYNAIENPKQTSLKSGEAFGGHIVSEFFSLPAEVMRSS